MKSHSICSILSLLHWARLIFQPTIWMCDDAGPIFLPSASLNEDCVRRGPDTPSLCSWAPVPFSWRCLAGRWVDRAAVPLPAGVRWWRGFFLVRFWASWPRVLPSPSLRPSVQRRVVPFPLRRTFGCGSDQRFAFWVRLLQTWAHRFIWPFWAWYRWWGRNWPRAIYFGPGCDRWASSACSRSCVTSRPAASLDWGDPPPTGRTVLIVETCTIPPFVPSCAGCPSVPISILPPPPRRPSLSAPTNPRSFTLPSGGRPWAARPGRGDRCFPCAAVRVLARSLCCFRWEFPRSFISMPFWRLCRVRPPHRSPCLSVALYLSDNIKAIYCIGWARLWAVNYRLNHVMFDVLEAEAFDAALRIPSVLLTRPSSMSPARLLMVSSSCVQSRPPLVKFCIFP